MLNLSKLSAKSLKIGLETPTLVLTTTSDALQSGFSQRPSKHTKHPCPFLFEQANLAFILAWSVTTSPLSQVLHLLSSSLLVSGKSLSSISFEGLPFLQIVVRQSPLSVVSSGVSPSFATKPPQVRVLQSLGSWRFLTLSFRYFCPHEQEPDFFHLLTHSLLLLHLTLHLSLGGGGAPPQPECLMPCPKRDVILAPSSDTTPGPMLTHSIKS